MQTVVLTSSGQRLELAPARGGLALSYQVEGVEVLYLDRATFDDPSKNVRGGIPVLFPWAGPLPEGTFGWPGALPQHGAARQSAWELVGAEQDSVTMRLGPHPELFPYQVELELRLSLSEEGLRLDSLVTNRDSREAPVQLGFHPYFAVGDKAGLKLELPGTSYRDNDSPDRLDIPFRGPLPLTERQIDWELRGLQASRAALTDPARGTRLELAWSERFAVLVVWSLLDKPFVCLEPWSAGRFAQSIADPDLWRLPPGQTASAWWTIRQTRI